MAEEESAGAKGLISDEEASALLEKPAGGKGEVKPYDLAGTQRITRGRLPALETIPVSYTHLTLPTKRIV